MPSPFPAVSWSFSGNFCEKDWISWSSKLSLAHFLKIDLFFNAGFSRVYDEIGTAVVSWRIWSKLVRDWNENDFPPQYENIRKKPLKLGRNRRLRGPFRSFRGLNQDMLFENSLPPKTDRDFWNRCWRRFAFWNRWLLRTRFLTPAWKAEKVRKVYETGGDNRFFAVLLLYIIIFLIATTCAL